MKYVVVVISTFLILAGCSDEANEGVLTDIDGNEYKTVKIGQQWWMADNLITTHYQNGESIPNVVDGGEWSGLDSGAYSVYENDPSNIAIYGIHYNWYAATDPRGICPAGWHVPSDDDWMALELYLGIDQEEIDTFSWRGTNEGGKLKDTNPDYWQSPPADATNETGFSARPGGGRASDSSYGGGFFYQGERLAIWSSDEHSNEDAVFRAIWLDRPGILRNHYNKGNGFSLRCIKDQVSGG